MFFEKRKCAARVLGFAGLPFDDKASMVLVNMMVADAKASHQFLRRTAAQVGSSIKFHDQDLVISAAIHLHENPSATVPLTECGLSQPESEALLKRLSEAATTMREMRSGFTAAAFSQPQ